MTDTSKTLEAALQALEAGLRPIPIEPGGKKPLVRWKDFQTRPPTEEQVRQWWAEWPGANLAILAGEGSGVDVVDIDSGHAPWPPVDCELPTGYVCQTPRGGWHYGFRHLPGCRDSGSKLATGVDVRGDGGYVLIPPSVVNGKPYVLVQGSLVEALTTEAPPWLQAVLLDGKSTVARAAVPNGTIPEGARNDTLTRLAGAMRRQGAGEPEILAALKEANSHRCQPPLPDNEVEAIAESVSQYAPAEEPATATGGFPLTRDYAHATALAILFKDHYRWAEHRGTWMEWTGKVWRPTSEAFVATRASEELRAHYGALMARTGDKDGLKRLATLAVETCIFARILGGLSFLKGMPNFLTLIEEWDRDPWALNCSSGLIDLHTGDLRAHQPGDLCTKMVLAQYDRAARSAAWERHLERFLPNPDIRRQVQRDMGKALPGAVLEEALPIWYGVGANAKTTTARVFLAVLGGYARRAAPDLLVQSTHDRHPTEVADLLGTRWVFASESQASDRLDEALVKDLTGGDRKKARYMRQDFFEFEQTFSLVLVTNHRPRVRGTDEAIWRRLRLIPWMVRIASEERRPQDEVVAELAADGAAVLSWMLDGLADWRQDSKWTAKEVVVATTNYRREEDRLGGFLEECCELKPFVEEAAAVLYPRYESWATAAGEQVVSKTAFGALLRERGLVQSRSGTGARLWTGIRIKRGPGLTQEVTREPGQEG